MGLRSAYIRVHSNSKNQKTEHGALNLATHKKGCHKEMIIPTTICPLRFAAARNPNNFIVTERYGGRRRVHEINCLHAYAWDIAHGVHYTQDCVYPGIRRVRVPAYQKKEARGRRSAGAGNYLGQCVRRQVVREKKGGLTVGEAHSLSHLSRSIKLGGFALRAKHHSNGLSTATCNPLCTIFAQSNYSLQHSLLYGLRHTVHSCQFLHNAYSPTTTNLHLRFSITQQPPTYTIGVAAPTWLINGRRPSRVVLTFLAHHSRSSINPAHSPPYLPPQNSNTISFSIYRRRYDERPLPDPRTLANLPFPPFRVARLVAPLDNIS